MKSDIEYFYNIKIENLNSKGNYYFFESNYNKYYFVVLTRPLEDLQDLLTVTSELQTKNIKCHEFIYNKDNKIVTVIDDIKYVLLKVNYNSNESLDLIDITNFQKNLVLNPEKSKLYRNDWANLWSEKIDYFEYQIREIGKEKELVLNSFSYYIGLAENAISYVNNINENYMGQYTLTLCHKRIYYPNYPLNFYNPLSFIFDLRSRDVAEYLKFGFFQKEDVMLELENYLRTNNLSNYEYRMLYARLLYPSYYFDLYEKIMANELNEDVLVNVIALVDEYEIFLKEAYILINKHSPLEPIEWIMKKDANTL